jgi:DNA-binding winged helix-turn-helix (wHTH) protein/tetratricopeptide (TPR) repeat protein
VEKVGIHRAATRSRGSAPGRGNGETTLFRFGEHELDAALFELRQGGRRVPVQPKPLALLLYLARHRDRLVTREELVAQLWPDTVVGDDALFHAVKVARGAVGDRGRHQSVIETVRGVGFRFVAPVIDGPPGLARRPVRRRRPGRRGEEPPPLLGREALLARVLAALDATSRGRGRIVFLSGEPGVGKTRILDAVGDAARTRGARVARGGCREAGGPAFAPWSEALESLFTGVSDAELAALADRATGAWLALLAPGLRERLPSLAPIEPGELHRPESRWSCFGAVARALSAAAAARPLVLLLDDLHWADVASLRLVEFLLGDLSRRAILIVGVHRDERLAPGHPLTAVVAEAARLEVGELLRVERLVEEEIARLLAALVGSPPPAAVARAVHARTAGNPFFVVQIAREIAPISAHTAVPWEEALARVPTAVRQVMGGSLARLGESTRDLLTLAAVAGSEFDPPLLLRASAHPPDDVLDALEEAVAARILEEAPGAPGRLRFAHALIQEAILADLPRLRRARLHLAVGEALEALFAGHPEPPAVSLAHHYQQAADVGATAAALRWAIRAGDLGMRQGAYEEAAVHYENAVSRLGLVALEPESRFDLLLALGRARHFGLGDYVRARQAFGAAAAVARELRDPARLAEAALAYAAIPQPSMPEVEQPCRAVLEDALGAQPPEATLACARLRARLGAFLANDPRHQAEAVELATRALASARELEDPRTILEALVALQRALRLQGIASPEERLVLSAEAAGLAARVGDAVLETVVHGQRIAPHLELGRGPDADAEIARYAVLAERVGAPAWRWTVPVLRAMQQLLHGELDRVEATALAALPIAARVPDSVARFLLSTLLFVLRREQGRLAEVEGPMRAIVDRFAALPSPRAWLALLLVECGRADEARREVGRLASEGLARFAGTEGWRASLAALAETVVALGDAANAARLYAELLPAERYCLVLGDGVLCLGPAARVLGSLAALLERWDEAEAHFSRALELSQSLGSPSWAARTRLDFARALLRRGRPEDRARAKQLLCDASEAEALGMARVAVEARALASRIG